MPFLILFTVFCPLIIFLLQLHHQYSRLRTSYNNNCLFQPSRQSHRSDDEEDEPTQVISGDQVTNYLLQPVSIRIVINYGAISHT